MSDALKFRYEGLDQSGETAKGTVRADSEDEALTKLKQKGLIVSSLNVLKETVAGEVAPQSEIRFRYSGTNEDGEESSGTIKAESKEQATHILNERGVTTNKLTKLISKPVPVAKPIGDVSNDHLFIIYGSSGSCVLRSGCFIKN